MVRTILNITAVADVTTIFIRIFFGIVRALIILIFGRRLQYLDVLASPFLFNQLKRTNKGI
jgi:hypothetical protein